MNFIMAINQSFWCDGCGEPTYKCYCDEQCPTCDKKTINCIGDSEDGYCPNNKKVKKMQNLTKLKELGDEFLSTEQEIHNLYEKNESIKQSFDKEFINYLITNKIFVDKNHKKIYKHGSVSFVFEMDDFEDESIKYANQINYHIDGDDFSLEIDDHIRKIEITFFTGYDSIVNNPFGIKVTEEIFKYFELKSKFEKIRDEYFSFGTHA